MPRIELRSRPFGGPIPLDPPTGGRLLVPRVQFRCWVRVPNFPTTRDAVIDTGSPFTWMPQAIWSNFRAGIDYEELPFAAGYRAPGVITAGWSFTFRFVRLLQPLVLLDTTTELERHGVVVQLADGDPPALARSNAPAYLVIGLYGGLLADTRLHIAADASGNIAGALEW